MWRLILIHQTIIECRVFVVQRKFESLQQREKFIQRIISCLCLFPTSKTNENNTMFFENRCVLLFFVIEPIEGIDISMCSMASNMFCKQNNNHLLPTSSAHFSLCYHLSTCLFHFTTLRCDLFQSWSILISQAFFTSFGKKLMAFAIIIQPIENCVFFFCGTL